MDVRFSLEVPAGPFAAATARRSLEGMRRYLEPQPFEDTRLLLSELVTNSARHAGLHAGDHIVIHVQAGRDGVYAEVCDPGHGFDPGSTQPTETSGWGLRLVQTLAHRWGVRRDGGRTIVWFEIPATPHGNDVRVDARRDVETRHDEANAS